MNEKHSLPHSCARSLFFSPNKRCFDKVIRLLKQHTSIFAQIISNEKPQFRYTEQQKKNRSRTTQNDLPTLLALAMSLFLTCAWHTSLEHNTMYLFRLTCWNNKGQWQNRFWTTSKDLRNYSFYCTGNCDIHGKKKRTEPILQKIGLWFTFLALPFQLAWNRFFGEFFFLCNKLPQKDAHCTGITIQKEMQELGLMLCHRKSSFKQWILCAILMICINLQFWRTFSVQLNLPVILVHFYRLSASNFLWNETIQIAV